MDIAGVNEEYSSEEQATVLVSIPTIPTSSCGFHESTIGSKDNNDCMRNTFQIPKENITINEYQVAERDYKTNEYQGEKDLIRNKNQEIGNTENEYQRDEENIKVNENQKVEDSTRTANEYLVEENNTMNESQIIEENNSINSGSSSKSSNKLENTAAIVSKKDYETNDIVSSMLGDEEGLGENYQNSPWVAPSYVIAKVHSSLTRFGGGKASVFKTTIKELTEMGPGIGIYFILLKYLSILFFLMSILAIPSAWLNYDANGLDSENSDALGMAYLSLGNQRNCTPSKTDDCLQLNTTFTNNAYTVSYVISGCDFAYSILFLLFIPFFKQKIRRVIVESDRQNVTASDYAIFIRGLPKTATEKEIHDHFNSRYRLDQLRSRYPMWFGCLGRSKVVRAPLSQKPMGEPVTNLDHVHGYKLFSNSWIAEVAIGRPIGDLIRTFKSMDKLTERIRINRAIVKKFSIGTSYKRGPNARIRNSALKNLKQVETKMNKKTSKLKSVKFSDIALTECHSAFVIFNNAESQNRCLDDYRLSRNWLHRNFQPTSLRFLGKYPLNVQRAPEPSNILWENLETSKRMRFLRRIVTNGITLLLLLGTFLIINAAQQAQNTYADGSPRKSLCSTEIPAILYGSYNFSSQMKWQWVSSMDSTCNSNFKEFYISYSDNPTATPSAVLPSAPAPSVDLFTGNTTELTRCDSPCVSTLNRTKCSTLPCFDSSLLKSGGRKCETYSASSMLACFCVEGLQNYTDKYGILKGATKFYKEITPCQEYAKRFTISNALVAVAALCVAIVNVLLKSVLTSLAKFERHDSVSAEAQAKTLKLFFAQFLNTALIVLLVNANLPAHVGNLSFLPGISLFNGRYIDFNPGWYTVVGTGIVTTMLVNVILPHIPPLISMYIIHPFNKCFSRFTAVTQSQLNSGYEGSEFDISVRYPIVLNSVFVTMLYCGGLPILLIVASVTCGLSFWIDKYTLLRLYQRPPDYDETLAGISLSSLPYALLGHLLLSTWMYGNASILQSNVLNVGWILKKAGIAHDTAISPQEAYQEFIKKAKSFDPFGDEGLVVRIVRLNTFPIFVLFLVIATGMIILALFGIIVSPILEHTLQKIVSYFLPNGRAKIVPDGGSNDLGTLPPYTGKFCVRVSPGTRVDTANGWNLSNNLLTRTWTVSGVFGGHQREKGQPMLTWEALPGLASYNILMNRSYHRAVAELYKSKLPSTTFPKGVCLEQSNDPLQQDG